MSWYVLQSASTPATATAVSSVSVTLPNPLSSGTTLIAVTGEPAHGIHNVGVPNDGQGNAFASISTAGTTHALVSLAAMPTPPGDVGTTPTFTASVSGGSAQAGMIVLEVSGLDSTGLTGVSLCDGSPLTASSSGGTSTSSPNYASSAVGEFLFALYADNGGTNSWTAPSAMTADPSSINGNQYGNLAIAYADSQGSTEYASWAISNSADYWAVTLGAFTTPAPPGDPVVTVTQGGSPSAGMALSVVVLTGAAETGGASYANQFLPGAAQGNLTPSFTGSRVYWAIADDTSTTTWTYDASNSSTGNTGCGDFADTGSGSELTAGAYTGTVVAGTPVTVGASAPTTGNTSIAAYEVPGASTVDASTPAFKTSTGSSVASNAFSPPAGAVLVALVACDGSGSGLETLSISDTAGLTWTRRAISNTTGTTWSLCAVFTATIPVVSSGQIRFQPGDRKWRRLRRRIQQPLLPQMSPAQPVPLGMLPVLRDRQPSLVPIRAGLNRITAGARFPSIGVPFTRSKIAAIQRQPKQLARLGVLPGAGLSVIPPAVTTARPARPPRRPRGTVTNPLIPGAVAVVSPVRPVASVTARRAVQIQPRQRLFTGLLSGRGLSGIPPAGFTRLSYHLVRRVTGLLRGGYLPGAGLSGIPEQPARSKPAQIQRQPRQRLAAGMLPGAGLSGIPPTVFTRPRNAPLVPAKANRLARGERGSLTVAVPVPVVLRNRQKTRPVQQRVSPPPFVPAGVVYQPVSSPTIISRVRYRLARAPQQRVAAGMLPGRGLSGIPPTSTVRSRQAPRVPLRAWNQLIPGQRGNAGVPVPVTVILRSRNAPAVPRARARNITGFPGSLTAPIPVPVVLRNRQKARALPSRFIRGSSVPAVSYPPVIQQARSLRPAWRLVRQSAQRLLAGMLPGVIIQPLPPQFLESALGGSAVQYGAYGGISFPVSIYGGTVTPFASSGGIAVQANPLGGTETPVIQMSMMQNLQAFENNDTAFLLQITQFGSPMNLTGYTLKLFVKATQQAPDSGATVYTIGSGLTMTQVLGGEFTFMLPHTATTASGTQWWRVDITSPGGQTGTALYGNLYILAA